MARSARKGKKPTWYRVLEVGKALRTGITSPAIAAELHMEMAAAAAWLSKLAKWGYLRRTGLERAPGRPRAVVVFTVTAFGERYKPGAGLGSSIDRYRSRPDFSTRGGSR